MTGPGKTGLIYKKYTCTYYGTYISPVLYICAMQSLLVLLNFTWISAYYYNLNDDFLDTIQITDKKLLHFKLSKLDQIICVDKTVFSRPTHYTKLYTVC